LRVKLIENQGGPSLLTSDGGQLCLEFAYGKVISQRDADFDLFPRRYAFLRLDKQPAQADIFHPALKNTILRQRIDPLIEMHPSEKSFFHRKSPSTRNLNTAVMPLI
jgi:hypothetical protein